MYYQIWQKLDHFSSTQRSVPSSSFLMFIVLGIYNFALSSKSQGDEEENLCLWHASLPLWSRAQTLAAFGLVESASNSRIRVTPTIRLNCPIGLLLIILSPQPERIYNPITAMGFFAMFTFQLDNTKR